MTEAGSSADGRMSDVIHVDGDKVNSVVDLAFTVIKYPRGQMELMNNYFVV